MLNRAEEELPSAFDVPKADDRKLQEIMENAAKSMESLIEQLEDPPLEHFLYKLLGLDKELRSIRGSLKVETVKKVQLEERIEREKCKFVKIHDDPEYDDGTREDIRKRTERLNASLKVRQECIDLLKGRLTNQITEIKETIAKVLDKDTSLAKKIWKLFREQDIMTASILMTTGMAISILVEVLLSSGVAAQGRGGGGDCKPENVNEWLRNKLKALVRLLGRLGMKVAEPLPDIIWGISWILNRAKEVVG